MALNDTAYVQPSVDDVSIPGSLDTPQQSRRTTSKCSPRLQQAIRNSHSDLETGDQNSNRKRRRNEPRECNNGTKKLPQACCQGNAYCEWAKSAMLQEKIINNLVSRVSALEQRIRTSDLQEASPQLQRLNRAEPKPNSLPSGKYICPLQSCGKSFRRPDNLSRHILDARSSEHKKIAGNLNHTYCVPCQRHFTRPSDFTRHEKNHHEELYKERLHWFEKGSVNGRATTMSKSPLPFSGPPLSPSESVCNHMQSISDNSQGSTDVSRYKKVRRFANSREILSGDMYSSPIEPPSSSLGVENDLERLHRTTQPGSSSDDNLAAGYTDTIHGVDACTRHAQLPSSDDVVLRNEPLFVEEPFLPQCFFDVGPYDLRTSPSEAFTSYSESIDNECQSPFLPPAFFDAGPYDLRPMTEEEFVSYTEDINAPTLHPCSLDTEPYDK